MRRQEVTEAKRSTEDPLPLEHRLTKREIDRRLTEIAQELCALFADSQPETLVISGEEILVMPVDTRRLIKHMSRHLCFN